MQDETEPIRRARQAELINELDGLTDEQAAREALEAQYGQVYSTPELRSAFTVIGFAAPYVVAVEKATGKKGSLEFTHSPRFYFNWIEDK
jgi:hypothetical protein